MNYVDSVQYLSSLGNEVSAMKLGLENIRTLLDSLGNPQNNFLKIQVAGTNGKGSVCAFLDAICLSADIKTGLYTSPHLISMTERIKIGGVDISETEFARLATSVRETAEDLLADSGLNYLPTFFEQVTAIALIAFAEAKVELAILETGLGGRLDAVTAANAEIAAITSIDLDHQEYLGETLAEIAAEKAAIIRHGSHVVVGKQMDEAKNVVEERLGGFQITARRAEYVRTACVSGRNNLRGPRSLTKAITPNEAGVEGRPSSYRPLTQAVLTTEKAAYHVRQISLAGRHQVENAKIAILLAEILQDDFPITSKNISHGLENARHPGRLEYDGRFLFDGAHNVAGANALREYLDEFVHQPITIIFAAMKDKDIGEIGEIIFPKADKLILTKPENSRSVDPNEILRQMSGRFDRSKLILTYNVKDATARAIEVTDEDGIILVTGSLYLVGEVKKMINN